jgi:hypothetical protein
VTPLQIRAVLSEQATRVKFFDKAHRYALDGRHSPSVTTITRLLHREQLERWRVRQQALGTARACVASPILLSESVEDYATRMLAEADKLLEADRVAKEAADIGTGFHSLIEWACRERIGQPTPRPEVSDAAEALFERWMEWTVNAAFDVVAVEQPVFSETWQYCGRVDLLANVAGRLTVLDWKSKANAGKLWPDQRLQSIAYRQAVYEMLKPPAYPEGLIVVVPRDGGDAKPLPVDSDREQDLNAFLHLLGLYHWQREANRA